MTTETERRLHVKSVLAERRMFQFGQPPGSTTLVAGGRVACGDACVQLAARVWTGERWTLDHVRRISGAPVGLPTSGGQLVTALRHLDLPYRVVHDARALDLVGIAATRGPVIVLESYSVHPEWRGYRYGGVMADDVPNGFAEPSGAAGKSQLVGFSGGHWVLLASSREHDGRIELLIRDPDHASAVRPERPPWDRVTLHQFRMMLESRRSVAGRTTAIIPTEVLLP